MRSVESVQPKLSTDTAVLFLTSVVTASSDRFVRAWNPHDPNSCLSPAVLGSHSDYVKALAYPVEAGTSWLASGSLDQHVRLWDVKELRREPIFDIHDSASVYCLATDSRGGLVAVGTPENGIRLYDPREDPASSGPAGQLIGHTDMIRSMLVSSDGRNLLSASSDGTVRLWDIGQQRMMHTFSYHSASVTALCSQKDDLSIFYSADREGLLCKIDGQDCGELDEAECVVLAQSEGPINKVVALDDAFVWTCGDGPDVQCWQDIPTRSKRHGLYPIRYEGSSYHLDRRESANSALGVRAGWTTFEEPTQSNEEFESAAAIEHMPAQTRTSLEPKSSLPSALKSSSASTPDVTVPTPTPLSEASHVSFSLDDSERPDSTLQRQGASVSVAPQTKLATAPTDSITPNVDPRATLFGIPFDSLVCLSTSDSPYGLGTAGAMSTGNGLNSMMGGRDSIFHAAAGRPSFGDKHRGSSFSIGRNSFATDGGTQLPAANVNLARLTQIKAASTPRDVMPSMPNLGRRSISTTLRFGSKEFDAQDAVNLAHRDSEMTEGGNDAGAVARRSYEERELAVQATPLRVRPIGVIKGARGLIRSTMLNDRRHVLTYSSSANTDVAGQTSATKVEEGSPEILLWDIVRCQCLGVFQGSEVKALLEVHDTPGDVLDRVRSYIEGYGANPAWCSIDTRNGTLAVHLDIGSLVDAEVYLDECDWLQRDAYARDDQRANLGVWVLRSLFADFADAEITLRGGDHPELPVDDLVIEHANLAGAVGKRKQQTTSRGAPSSGGPIATQTVAQRRQQSTLRMATSPRVDQVPFGALSPRKPGNTIGLAVAPQTPAVPPTGSAPMTPTLSGGFPAMATLAESLTKDTSVSQQKPLAGPSDYFSLGTAATQASQSATTQPQTPAENVEESALPSSTSTSGGLMGKLGSKFRNKDKTNARVSSQERSPQGQALSSGSKDDHAQSPSKPARHDLPAVAANRQVLAALSPPKPSEVAFKEGPPTIKLPPETSILISSASGDAAQWEAIYRGLVSSAGLDISALELAVPPWLLEILLGGKIPAPRGGTNAGKMSFMLLPSSNGMAGDKDSLPMPGLPSGDAKLTATRMLRLSKASQYVCEKLGFVAPSVKTPSQSRAASIFGGSRRPSLEGRTGKVVSSGFGMTSSTTNSPLASPALRGTASPMGSPSARGTPSRGTAKRGMTADELELEPLGPKDLELVCNGHVLDPDLTLMQVARFYWKSSGDVTIEYRRKATEAVEWATPF